MKPARIVFPGFWFGQSDLAQAEKLARRGVGGFCVYGGNAEQTRDFTRRMNEASPYGRLLFCAEVKEDLREVVPDVPALPANTSLAHFSKPSDAAYRKGNLLGRLARACGIDWVLAPVVDLGYTSPPLGDEPFAVTSLAGDMLAGISNAGVLNCLKYFPGAGGVLKTLLQLEEAEIVPYKHLFRRTDAIMPSDMVFTNLDDQLPAMLSDKILKGLLRKRLNYKGCLVSFPLSKARLRYEESSAVKMLHAGVENILSPRNASGVIDAIEREVNKGFLADEIIHAVSNQEMAISKVQLGPQPDELNEVKALISKAFH